MQSAASANSNQHDISTIWGNNSAETTQNSDEKDAFYKKYWSWTRQNLRRLSEHSNLRGTATPAL